MFFTPSSNKIVETNAEKYDFCVADLQTTFKKLYISQDFVNITRHKLSPEDEDAVYSSLTRSIPVTITKKGSKSDSSKKASESSDAPPSLYKGKTKYLSNVILLNGKDCKDCKDCKDDSQDTSKKDQEPNPTTITTTTSQQQSSSSSGTTEKTSSSSNPFLPQTKLPNKKGKVNFHELEKDIKVMVSLRDRTIVAPGGFWNSDLDGPDPSGDSATLIRTATRCFKAQTQIDLSSCQRWVKFSEAHYFLKEEGVDLVSVTFIPVYTPQKEVVVPSKNGQVAFSWLSLNGLLEYNEEDIGTFEISLFGELFKILLCSMFGRTILGAITKKMDGLRHSERVDGEPEAKRSKIEHTDKNVLWAFQFFDKGATGFVKSKDLSTILLFLNSGLSRRMAQDYVAQFESKESSGFVPYAGIVDED